MFSGIDDRSGEKVAIKKMTVSAKNIRYIISEIDIQMNTHHPNIVDYKGAYLLGCELWVSLEFMGGGDLASIIAILRENKKYMGEPQIAHITAEVS